MCLIQPCVNTNSNALDQSISVLMKIFMVVSCYFVDWITLSSTEGNFNGDKSGDKKICKKSLKIAKCKGSHKLIVELKLNIFLVFFIVGTHSSLISRRSTTAVEFDIVTEISSCLKWSKWHFIVTSCVSWAWTTVRQLLLFSHLTAPPRHLF